MRVRKPVHKKDPPGVTELRDAAEYVEMAIDEWLKGASDEEKDRLYPAISKEEGAIQSSINELIDIFGGIVE